MRVDNIKYYTKRAKPYIVFGYDGFAIYYKLLASQFTER